jgi:hypothetical protein
MQQSTDLNGQDYRVYRPHWVSHHWAAGGWVLARKAGLELWILIETQVTEVDVKFLESCRVKFVLVKGLDGVLKLYQEPDAALDARLFRGLCFFEGMFS